MNEKQPGLASFLDLHTYMQATHYVTLFAMHEKAFTKRGKCFDSLLLSYFRTRLSIHRSIESISTAFNEGMTFNLNLFT